MAQELLGEIAEAVELDALAGPAFGLTEAHGDVGRLLAGGDAVRNHGGFVERMHLGAGLVGGGAHFLGRPIALVELGFELRQSRLARERVTAAALDDVEDVAALGGGFHQDAGELTVRLQGSDELGIVGGRGLGLARVGIGQSEVCDRNKHLRLQFRLGFWT
jgi:hypothetical protein